MLKKLLNRAKPAQHTGQTLSPSPPHPPALAHRTVAALLQRRRRLPTAPSLPRPRCLPTALPPPRPLRLPCSGATRPRCRLTSPAAVRSPTTGEIPCGRELPRGRRANPVVARPDEAPLRSLLSSVCLSPNSPSPLGHGRRRRRAALLR
jgi:hypothetical protein